VGERAASKNGKGDLDRTRCVALVIHEGYPRGCFKPIRFCIRSHLLVGRTFVRRIWLIAIVWVSKGELGDEVISLRASRAPDTSAMGVKERPDYRRPEGHAQLGCIQAHQPLQSLLSYFFSSQPIITATNARTPSSMRVSAHMVSPGD
jgi:hypothetical protein